MPAPWSPSIPNSRLAPPARVLELTYTAWNLKAFAEDCGDDGPPFIWNPERRFQLRCEIDAALFHMYGISRDDTAYILDTRFQLLKRSEEREHGEYRTKRAVLETYDALAAAAAKGMPYRFAPRTAEEGDMSRFRFHEIRVDNYRCFEELRLPIEEDTTVLFAENGGGKTALLNALAMGLAVVPEGFVEDPETQRRARFSGGVRAFDEQEGCEPVGLVRGHSGPPRWPRWNPSRGRRRSRASTASSTDQKPAPTDSSRLVQQVRVPGERWPLFAWYGVDRLRTPPSIDRRKVERHAGPLGSLRLLARPEPG